MSKAIYALKMCLFRRQLSLTSAEVNGLLHVATFVVRVYIKYWYNTPDAIAAPRNDLQFLKELLMYELVNKKVARAAQDRFNNNLWYLSELSLGFSIFDEDLGLQERELIVRAMKERKGGENPPRRREIKASEVPTLKLSD